MASSATTLLAEASGSVAATSYTTSAMSVAPTSGHVITAAFMVRVATGAPLTGEFTLTGQSLTWTLVPNAENFGDGYGGDALVIFQATSAGTDGTLALAYSGGGNIEHVSLEIVGWAERPRIPHTCRSATAPLGRPTALGTRSSLILVAHTVLTRLGRVGRIARTSKRAASPRSTRSLVSPGRTQQAQSNGQLGQTGSGTGLGRSSRFRPLPVAHRIHPPITDQHAAQCVAHSEVPHDDFLR